MNNTAFVTIVSNNYLHFARTLMQSIAAQHPEADRYCVIVDRDMQHANALKDEFTPLSLTDIHLPDGDDFLFQYNVLELNTAVKPWALEALFNRGYQKVLYIDPDIYLYRPLAEVMSALDSGASVVLTPHLLSPIRDAFEPGELDIRRSGTYNLGFCALGKSDQAISLLHWWQEKLRHDCVIALSRGVFVDQSWMDLAPTLFAGVHILRHPGYNVAYWNLAQRPIDAEADGVRVDGQPLVFFHFSGLNPASPEHVSKHQNRLAWVDLNELTQNLFAGYAQHILDNGFNIYRQLPYGFACYDDGTQIAEKDRKAFREDSELRHQAFGRPFASKSLLADTGASLNQKTLSQTRQLNLIYAHFLGRQPDNAARQAFFAKTPSKLSTLKFALGVGRSSEARSKPGWLLRLLNWPMAHAQLNIGAEPLSAPTAPGAARAVARAPLLFSGLYEPEAQSAELGIWVGPELIMPTCPIALGKAVIRGQVDLAMLGRAVKGAGDAADFKLHVFGPLGHIASHTIATDGAFEFQFTIPAPSFQLGGTWKVLASKSIEPNQHGLGADSRQLSWRVEHIAVDDTVYIDSLRTSRVFDLDTLLQPPGINLIGYLAAELGVGEAARSLGRACLAAGVPFSAIDVGYQTGNEQRDREILDQAVKRHFPVDLMYVNADQTIATANYLKQKGYNEGRYRIGFWHWEQPRLPDSALNAFAQLDEIWVPSTFVQDAVLPVSPLPVFKVPHAIQCIQSPGAKRASFGLPEDKLLVLVMYDFHSYQYRKNPQAAIAAFRRAAAQRRDVALIIKTINGKHHPEARHALGDAVADLPNVIFIDDFLTRQQTWDLQACCDILLSLHRAEGFGLAPAEMMYFGKPVVATGWSANMDFMTPENSFPVKYTLKPLPERIGAYLPGPVWAEADTEHAAWCLTQLFDDASLRQRIGQCAAASIQTQLSTQAVGKLVRDRLNTLGLWYPALRFDS